MVDEVIASPPGGYVGEQHTAYRRGLVLGLTMAEVGILIIFVLLLLLALGTLRLGNVRKEVERFKGNEAVPSERLARLEAAERELEQIAAEVGSGEETPKDIAALVRVVREAAATGAGKSDLTEAKKELENIRRNSAEIQRTASRVAGAKDAETLAGQLIEHGRELANRTGQLQNAERRLQMMGAGKGERPCWAEPDGTIIYVYDVSLTSTGIRMREHPSVVGREFPVGAPRPAVSTEEILTESDFLARTKALYDFGRQKDQQCRFFVRIYDDTAATEKPLYKQELATVEGHFYKLLVNGRAPF